MNRALDFDVYVDESGELRPRGEDEAFVMAAVAARRPVKPRSDEEFWKTRLDLPNFRRFHAVSYNSKASTFRRRVVDIASRCLQRYHNHDDYEIAAVLYPYQAGQELPQQRRDAYFDLLCCTMAHLTRRILATERGAEATHLRLHLRLEQRTSFNVRLCEDALRNAVASVCREQAQANGRRAPQASVSIFVTPKGASVYLALADLVCYALYVNHARREPRKMDLLLLDDASLTRWITPEEARVMSAGLTDVRARPMPSEVAGLCQSWLRRQDRAWDLDSLEAEVKPANRPAEEIEAVWTLMLDVLEHLVEQARDAENATALLELLRQMTVRPVWTQSLTHIQQQRFALDLDSAARGLHNHSGQPVNQPLREELRRRSGQLLDHPEHREAVLLYHNRLAVAYLNQFAFQQALDQAQSLVHMVQARHRALSSGLGLAATGQPEQPQPEQGALLGTLGQARVFLAWRERDLEMIDAAWDDFESAKAHFERASDRQRQVHYQIHAALEKLRFWPEQPLRPQERDLLQTALQVGLDRLSRGLGDIEEAIIDQSCWDLALGLKVAWIQGADVPEEQLDALASDLLDWPEGLSPHPLEKIAGYTALLGSPQTAARLLPALEEGQGAPLTDAIAACFAAQARVRLGERTLAEATADLVERLDPSMRERMTRAPSPRVRVTEWLPFYYC
jgi:hypothetical protein